MGKDAEKAIVDLLIAIGCMLFIIEFHLAYSFLLWTDFLAVFVLIFVIIKVKEYRDRNK